MSGSSKKASAASTPGQKTLFSFFSKKPSPTTAKATPKSTSKKDEATTPDWQRLKVGSKISVYWPNDDEYYTATVQQVPSSSNSSSQFTLLYDDGEMERLDLAKERFRILDSESTTTTNTKSFVQNKKRRIQEEEEEESDEEQEFELNNEESSEESAYEHNNNDKDDDDEDEAQWMVTDDEDDIVRPKANKRKPVLTVTHHSNRKTPPPANKKQKKSSSFETPNVRSTTLKTTSHSNNTTDSSLESIKVTPAFSASKHSTTTPPPRSATRIATHATPLAYSHGVVNPAGSHVHNHLKFLQSPRDAQGRTRDDPSFDAKTLRVDYRELDRLQGNGKSLSPASRQWWELKSKYADTVLLFKTGKFYELFHHDADVGVQVLDFLYMKGHVAHAGFPEVSYGTMAERLVRAGYKVARVEQTETPQQLKERNQTRNKHTPSRKVVNREVCSILTSGTRTFCYLDDTQGLSVSSANVHHGPLLVIREVLVLDENKDLDADEVQPVCEYGITLVDAVHATVTIGQFADDVLRSRMNTLLTSFAPSEILVEGGTEGASPTLRSLLKSACGSSVPVVPIHEKESFPKSTAIDAHVRRQLERPNPTVRPWDVQEFLDEMHRGGYYPRASRKKQEALDTSRWPHVLRMAVEGKAELALSSFGAALFYLQRNLIDQDILGMGIVKAYMPPTDMSSSSCANKAAAAPLRRAVREQQRKEDGLLEEAPPSETTTAPNPESNTMDFESMYTPHAMDESLIDHLALDGTTLQNLEILFNAHSHTAAGSLWSKINHAKSPHGSRLLRAWLLRPLFRKADIDRRAAAVQELVSGGAAMAMSEARHVLAKCGDMERLLTRVHSMGAAAAAVGNQDEDRVSNSQYHPNERAVLYEAATHTKRKVGDFSKILQGLRHATQIPELFQGVELESDMLKKITRTVQDGGCFPDMMEELDWFFNNFDCEQAAKGMFEMSRGTNETYDDACDAIDKIKRQLADYKDEMCGQFLSPSSVARSQWKYINTKEESKDKYLIELPAKVRVPDDFLVKGKRGKGDKQVNKYRTPVVEQLVAELEHALDVQKAGKETGMQLVFAKFASMRNLWAAAAHATAMLDALGSLAQMATRPGYTRPQILDCPPDGTPCIRVMQGRHPCVDNTHTGGEFIPNDLSLGNDEDAEGQERVLLLSGPNMGGKSTLLRQTCLIAILAQIGSYVPAEECALTPIDRIFTRLGATDRILVGQSTFFVELAETAAALRGATRRSLVIMDELGRGTATFDGTAIASATVKHLVEQNQCLTLFATHYHSLLNDWKDTPNVRLGHMECIVDGTATCENMDDSTQSTTNEDEEDEETSNKTITFLYTLGQGACPKSFGINVARLAALPDEVLENAAAISSKFETEMLSDAGMGMKVTPSNALQLEAKIRGFIESSHWPGADELWRDLQS